MSGSADCSVAVWDGVSGALRHHLRSQGEVLGVCALGNGLVASCSADSTVTVYDVIIGEQLHLLAGHRDRVTCLVSGLCRARAAEEGVLRRPVPSPRCSQCVRKPHPEGGISSPRGSLLVTGSVDTTLRVWQVTTGLCCHELRGHTSDISSLCALPDMLGGSRGAIVCSSAFDSTLRIWDVEAGACLRVLTDEDDFPFISSVAALGPHHVVSVSSFNPLRVWDVDSAECVDIIPRTPAPAAIESLARLFDAAPGLVLERGDLFLPVVFAAGAAPYHLDDAVTSQLRLVLRGGRTIIVASSGPAVHFLEVVEAGTPWVASSFMSSVSSPPSTSKGGGARSAAHSAVRSPGLPPLHPKSTFAV